MSAEAVLGKPLADLTKDDRGSALWDPTEKE